jgi:dTDP-4-amino-4,6-dideoxygalactose transaminase
MKNTFVTQPSLPPLEEFIPYLEQIWENKILTNNGEFHQLLESKLAEYLGVKYVSLFSNGTLALITALQALRVKGEVITTPFTFVATTHSLYWNNIKPVFCDIKPEDGNIDETKIEGLITPETTAIMPVHVYGHPCNIEEIQRIADIYGLKVIYDAAHAFNVKKNNHSILNSGDLSVLSFHATKIFNTFEGGAIISNDLKTKKRIDYLKNFGFQNETSVITHGINAKMNEVQASMGLLQLKYIDNYISRSKLIFDFYVNAINSIIGISLFNHKNNISYNYSYFPILVNEDYPLTRDELYDLFKSNNIYVRRYFYPLVTDFSPYKDSAKNENLPVANSIASRILCLPIYPFLEEEIQNKIVILLNER